MNFSNTYIGLDEVFYQKTRPKPVQAPQLLLWNSSLAEQLMISNELKQDSVALAEAFSGNYIMPGSEPIATAYAGNQFGHFVPQFGEGHRKTDSTRRRTDEGRLYSRCHEYGQHIPFKKTRNFYFLF